MPFFGYIYIFIFIASLLVALLVLSRGISDKRNTVFGLLSLSLSVWVFTTLMSNLFDSYEVVLLWSRLAIIGPAFIPALFLYFSWVFPYDTTVKLKKILVISIIPFVIVITIFTDLNVKSIHFTSWGSTIEAGEIYYLLFFYYIGFFLLGMRNLNRNAGKDKKVKVQTNLIIGGVTITLLISLFTNIFLLFFEDNGSSLIGPPSTIFFIGATAYAILRHQFLEVRILLGRIAYNLILGLFAYAIYYVIYFIDTTVFGSVLAPEALAIGVLNAFIFVLIYKEFNEYIRNQVNTRLINPGYNPLATIDRLSRNLATLLSIQDIVDQTLDTLSKTIRANYEAILIYPEGQKNVLFYESKKQSKDFDPGVARKIISIWNKTGKSIINVDSFHDRIPKSFGSYQNDIIEICEYLRDKGMKLLIPLQQSDNTLGFIVMGQKEADSPYNSIDIEFLQGIASNIGSAVARSLYYIEVQDLNRNLQRKVDEATKDLAVKNTRLEKALKRLEEIRRQERDMVDVMGHELRTPITIVRNALLVLKSKLDENEDIPRSKLVDYINKSVESTKREITLVETLLSATKVEANRIQLHFTKVDMVDVIRDGIEGQKAFAKQRDIKVKFDKPKKGYFAYCDRTRIQEIMDNFLSNAIKYTVRGHVDILISQDKQMVSIAVKDTGIGISKEDLEKLGRKFFRAKQYVDSHEPSKPGVTRPGGTGLGLYVSFNMIRIMNGKFNVESKLGKGSTFTFSMPLYTGQPDKDFDQTFEQEEI